MERTTLFLLLLILACTGPASDEMGQELLPYEDVEFMADTIADRPDIIPDVVNNFLHDMDYPEHLLLDTARTFTSSDSLAAYKKMADVNIRAYVAEHPDSPAMLKSNLMQVNNYFLQYLLFKMVRDKTTEKDLADVGRMKMLISIGKSGAAVNPRYLIEVWESFPEKIRQSADWKEQRELLNVKPLAGLSMLEAPDVTLQTRDPQRQVQLEETLPASDGASYTILVFTASWCTACHVDYTRNKHQFDAVQRNNVRVISYSLDTKLANWQKLISKEDYIQEAYCDLQGFDSPFAQYLEIGSIPHYVLIDSEMKIVSSYSSSNVREMFDYLKN